MHLNRITLAFKEKELDEGFHEAFFRQSLRQVRACLALGILVYTVFTISDGISYPSIPRAILWWRVIIVDLALTGLLALSFSSLFRRVWQCCLMVMMIVGVGGLAVSYVTTPLPFRYTYHVAFVLSLIWAYTCVRLRFIWASLTGFITILIYNVCLFWLGGEIEMDIAINTNLDVIAGNLMCMFAGYAMEYSLRESYYLSVLLGREKNGLEAEVKLRTQHLASTVTTLEQVIKVREQEEKEKKILESKFHQAQKMDALGTLAGGIAHDFNNILTVITGYTEMALADAKEGVSNYELLEEVQKAGSRAKDLVNQILVFSRKLEPELKPTDINQVVAQTEKMLERTIPKMINIECRLSENLWLIKADSSQLSQVLINLGTNAKDAMPEGGLLVIETENVTLDAEYCDRHQLTGAAPGDYVLLTVSDNGHGMDQETQEKIFDPFFTRKEIGKGTGLGLSTVHGIIKTHGGYIKCHSEIGHGTTFKVYLPVILPTEQDEISDEIVDVETQGGNETILLVDDENSIREMSQQILTRRGYRIMLASTGEEALDIYREKGSDIDLVVLDLSMPGIGGYRCFQELLKINPKAKIIIDSGYPKVGRFKDVIEAGAAGFIPKPYSIAELLKTVRRVLDE